MRKGSSTKDSVDGKMNTEKQTSMGRVTTLMKGTHACHSVYQFFTKKKKLKSIQLLKISSNGKTAGKNQLEKIQKEKALLQELED